MRRFHAALFVMLCLGGCAQAWADSVARTIARDLDRMQSYEGVTIERHLTKDGDVRRRVLYAKPGRFRVETLAPQANAGELVIYNGDQVVMWWPRQQFGIRLRGVPVPDRAQIKQHIEKLARQAMNAYAISLRSLSSEVAGQGAYEWRVIPTHAAPHRYRHVVWNAKRYPMPLKMSFVDREGAPWYAMEFESIAFDRPVSADAFSFAFPANAVVFEWDLGAPGIPLERAREEMNFAIKLPGAEHAIKKIVKAEHCLPMITLVMGSGATYLALTEMKDMGLADRPLGKPIKLGNRPAVLTLFGTFATITWVQDGTFLSLTGNIGFPELIAIAESVK